MSKKPNLYLVDSFEILDFIIFEENSHYEYLNSLQNYWKYTKPSGKEVSLDEFTLGEDEINLDINKYLKDFGIKNISKFYTDIISSKQKIYKKDVKKHLLELNTDLQIKNSLEIELSKLNKCLLFLNKESFNILKKTYTETLKTSVLDTINYFYSEYSNYISKQGNQHKEYTTKNDSIGEIIYSDEIKNFKQIEHILIINDWINENDNSLTWKKNKTKLVDFSRFLVEKKITRGNITITKVIRFLENRYNIDVGDLKKPSKFSKRPLKRSDFIFLLD